MCEIYNSKYRSWKIKFLYFLFNEKYNLTKKYKILQKIWKILEKYDIVNKRDGGGEKMNCFNLKITLLLKQDLRNVETYEKISNLISYAMLKDKNLKEIHETNTFKNYVFCSLYPVQKDGIYKQNNIYSFDLRGLEFTKIMKLKQVMTGLENDYFKIIQINLKTHEQIKINKLVTLTPAIITTPKGDYDIKEDMDLVKNRILANTQKKYKNIYDTTVDIDFIKSIKKTNRQPIKIPYKNINMLGNKFEIEVKEDPMSQNLAYLAMSVGILEKNSIGFGFCMAR